LKGNYLFLSSHLTIIQVRQEALIGSLWCYKKLLWEACGVNLVPENWHKFFSFLKNIIEGVSAKPCYSDDMGEKIIFAKGLEFLHVVFNIIEKRGPVFLLLVFALFSSYNVCKNTWLFLAMSLGVYLLNSKQADCFIVYEVRIKSHSIYRVEIWEQIVYIGYCDVNTIRESIECQTKYIEQKRDVPH